MYLCVTDMFLICLYKYVPLWQCTSVLLNCMFPIVFVQCLLGDAVVGTTHLGGTAIMLLYQAKTCVSHV